MSDNWVVQNLQKALATWNEKLQEIWTLLMVCKQSSKMHTFSPQNTQFL